MFRDVLDSIADRLDHVLELVEDEVEPHVRSRVWEDTEYDVEEMCEEECCECVYPEDEEDPDLCEEWECDPECVEECKRTMFNDWFYNDERIRTLEDVKNMLNDIIDTLREVAERREVSARETARKLHRCYMELRHVGHVLRDLIDEFTEGVEEADEDFKYLKKLSAEIEDELEEAEKQLREYIYNTELCIFMEMIRE